MKKIISALLDRGALKWIIDLIVGGVFVRCAYILLFSPKDFYALSDDSQSLLFLAFLMSLQWLVISLMV